MQSDYKAGGVKITFYTDARQTVHKDEKANPSR